MMLNTPLDNRRGVALIVTIMVVSFIIALSLEFNRTMRTHVASAGNVGQGLKALYVAQSGISYGMAMMSEDPPEADSLRDDWAVPDTLAKIAAASKGLLGGDFKLEIKDLSGRIPINLMVDNEKVKKVFTRLLRQEKFDLDTDTTNTIVDSTMDWIDSADQEDDFNRLYGAENDYYQSLDKPYQCKNGPLDAIEELLLVKGVSPQLFWGAEDKPGIGNCVTVYSQEGARINLNTAEPAVLEALSNDYDGKTLAGLREDATDAELESGQWYKDKIDKDFTSIVSTTSRFFQLTSMGHYGDASKEVACVIERNPDNRKIRILTWKLE